MDERARAAGGSGGAAAATAAPTTVAVRRRPPASPRPGSAASGRAARDGGRQGRTAGSGRQKEYCQQADPPVSGGGPVHNARNRWAALRSAAGRSDAGIRRGATRAARADGGRDSAAQDSSGRDSPGHAGTAMGSREQSRGPFQIQLVYSAAKNRASDLLEQARRQHAAAIASLHAERELYQRLGEQLTALADPASLDLEIAAIASRAGASVAQAEEDAARARRGQLTAEREARRRGPAARPRRPTPPPSSWHAATPRRPRPRWPNRPPRSTATAPRCSSGPADADGRADRARAEAAAANTAKRPSRPRPTRRGSVSEARGSTRRRRIRQRAQSRARGTRPSRTRSAPPTGIGAGQTRGRRAGDGHVGDRAREQVEAAEARAGRAGGPGPTRCRRGAPRRRPPP